MILCSIIRNSNYTLRFYSNAVENAQILERSGSIFTSQPSLHAGLLNKVSKLIGIKSWEDWYQVHPEDFIDAGGAPLLHPSGPSLMKVLVRVLPNYPWREWRFKYYKVSSNFWSMRSNQQDFMDDYISNLLSSLIIHKGDRLFTSDERNLLYKIDSNDVMKAGGLYLLQLYNHSLYSIFSTLYPSTPWKPWLFTHQPKGFWHERLNQRAFLTDLANSLHLKNENDWYKITSTQVRNYGGSKLLKIYNNSLISAIDTLIHHKTDQNSQNSSPILNNSPSTKLNILFDRIGTFLGIKRIEDWYKVTPNFFWTSLYQILNKEERLVVSDEFASHEFSFRRVLSKVYPLFRFQTFRFQYNIDNSSNENIPTSEHRTFFDRIGTFLYPILNPQKYDPDATTQLLSFADWHRVTKILLVENGAYGLVKKQYEGSLMKALKSIWPEHEWDETRMAFTLIHPPRHWRSLANRRRFMDEISVKLGYTKMEDWYGVRIQDLAVHGAITMLKEYYESSPVRALQSIYSEYPWQPWKFLRVNQFYWDSEKNAKDFIEYLKEELKIVRESDWNRVTVAQINSLGGSTLLSRYEGLHGLLEHFAPGRKISSPQTTTNPHTRFSQNDLFEVVQTMFPDSEVFSEYMHPALFYPITLKQMELDIFVPAALYLCDGVPKQIAMAFEYQGEQHYDEHFLFGKTNERQKKDHEKRIACNEAGIVLIEVPFWLDVSKKTVLQAIKERIPSFQFYKDSNTYLHFLSIITSLT